MTAVSEGGEIYSAQAKGKYLEGSIHSCRMDSRGFRPRNLEEAILHVHENQGCMQIVKSKPEPTIASMIQAISIIVQLI